MWKFSTALCSVSNTTGSRRISVPCLDPEAKNPQFPELALTVSDCPFVDCVLAGNPVLNDPPNPATSKWKPPVGIRVVMFTTAAFLLPYSASHPPVWKSI